jgi:hypothetical protein
MIAAVDITAMAMYICTNGAARNLTKNDVDGFPK